MKSSKIKKFSIFLGVAASLLLSVAVADKKACPQELNSGGVEISYVQKKSLASSVLLHSLYAGDISSFLPEQQNRIYSCLDQGGSQHFYWHSAQGIRHFSPQEFAVSGSTICGLQNGGGTGYYPTTDFTTAQWDI